MENIVPKISSRLPCMWNKIINLEKSLFPALKEELRLEELSHKEQKLIKILDFAQIEKNITVVSITNTPFSLPCSAWECVCAGSSGFYAFPRRARERGRKLAVCSL